jgi:transposase-like protein
MQALIDAVLAVSSHALDSEAAACDLLWSLRWPTGDYRCPECGTAECTRELAYVTCKQQHEHTILTGTPLGSLRRPRVRAIFLAIRAMARSHRSVSARELARDVGMPHNTLWRHMMRLRVMMPPQPPLTTPTGDRTATPRARVLVETVRTWVNGTFHGVASVWLPRYLQELAARWCCGAKAIAEALVEQLVRGGRELWFESRVRPGRQRQRRRERRASRPPA